MTKMDRIIVNLMWYGGLLLLVVGIWSSVVLSTAEKCGLTGFIMMFWAGLVVAANNVGGDDE